MGKYKRVIGGASALGLSLAGFVVAAPAAPADARLSCGSTVTQSATLTYNIGPCTGDGLDISTSYITLNLNGHRIFSTNAVGDIAGVRLIGVNGVTVRNGTVTGFNDGVAILGGAGNTVSNIHANNNVSDFGGHTGPNCNLGDGIGLFNTNHNMILGNVANNNGPYGGISLVDNATDNQVIGNTTNNNNVPAPPPHPRCIDNTNQDEGIRIEGPNASNNVVRGNTVQGNLLAGIGIHASNNVDPNVNNPPNLYETIENNKVFSNGLSNSDPNDSGISILSTPGDRSFGNTIRNNVSSNNFANGIYLPAGSHDNLVQGNLVNSNQIDGISLEGPTFSNKFTDVGPSLLQVTSPSMPPFVQGTDYKALSGSGSGDVTARLVAVGPISIPPTGFDTSASGCSPSDFAGFPVGAVALIQRGFCARSQKVNNAVAAGASAVIMFNEGSTGRTGLLTAGVGVVTIPVVGTTYALGVQLYNLTQAGPVTIHVVTNTTNVLVQTGPGAENNTLLSNRGKLNSNLDGEDANLNPPCDHNQWIHNLFGFINQQCVANGGGTGTIPPHPPVVHAAAASKSSSAAGYQRGIHAGS
ncbi:MAG: right-handed parallel beta-helix repeat-containing protein [Actinomycetota bacterium]|nr:right-handed parallel beta-helix repeat-containing protein [Actinomycetota bacterium]